MQRRNSLLICILVLLVPISGCIDTIPSETTITETSITESSETVPSTSNSLGTTSGTIQNQSTKVRNLPEDSEAKKLSLMKEEERVERILRNASGIKGTASVGVYGEVSAEIVERAENSLTVEVVMSYSYGYSCDDEGVVDGLTTRSTYVVTQGEVRLEKVHEGVSVYCE